jgi:flavin reductase (DIM6/NTAB) family NADH-FMN oxidoreductase RutF
MSTELAFSTTQQNYRHLMTYFPTGVTVVTSADAASCPYGLTCSSLTSICLQPPTLMVSLTSRSETLRHALGNGVFGVNLLGAQAVDTAQRFAAPSLDRFAGLPWRASPLGAPWLLEAVTATADCTIWRTMEVGDHTLLFGVVHNAEVPGGVPLLYGRRHYHQWQSETG